MIKTCMNEQLFTHLAAGANAFSSDAAQGCYGKWIPGEEFWSMSVQVVATGIDGATGVVKAQSCDLPTPSDAHALDVTGATVTLTAAGDFGFQIDGPKAGARWYRLAYVKGANTTGTIDAYVTLKG